MTSIPAHALVWLPVLVLGFYLARVVIVNYTLDSYLKVFLIVLAIYVCVDVQICMIIYLPRVVICLLPL